MTLFGYLGLRLTPDFTLHINPSLPPQIPNLKYRTFYWQGWPMSAVANQTHTTITRLSTPYMDANKKYANTSIPVQIGNNNSTTYQLPPSGTLTLKNRNIANVTTIPGNFAQCLPVSSPDQYQPGQFPLAAVDGAAYTKWQPNFSNTSQSITISLLGQPIQLVTGFYFDWAQTPPTKFTVTFHNTSTPTSDTKPVTSTNVTISTPYNATLASLITPYTSNTTNVSLSTPIYSAQYATLAIQGNQGNPASNATGATVAEWAIIGSAGQKMEVRSAGEERRVPVDLKHYMRSKNAF